MHGIKLAGIDLDRKILSDIAAQEAESFVLLIEQAKAALEKNKNTQKAA